MVLVDECCGVQFYIIAAFAFATDHGFVSRNGFRHMSMAEDGIGICTFIK